MILVCDRCGAATKISLEELYSLASGRPDTIPCVCCRLTLWIDDSQLREPEEVAA